LSKTRLGVLISGGGTNLQAIIDACEAGPLKGRAEVALVIANKPEAYGLERAKKHGIPAICVNRKDFPDAASFTAQLVEELHARQVGLVCLAGYLLKLETAFIAAFRGKIVNIHPALLPKFGGKGMYGRHVHEAVLATGEKESGASLHWVDEDFDHGAVILQRRVPVLPGDTPDTLAKRILPVEHQVYPEAILKVISGK